MHSNALTKLEIERSRKRAAWLRQLTEGAANLQFAEKLKDMTAEYDGLAEAFESDEE